MPLSTKRVLIGRRVKVILIPFEYDDHGVMSFATSRTLSGRAERVEEDRSYVMDEASAMDDPMEHYEPVKGSWTLNITEIRFVATFAGETQPGTIVVPDPDGGPSGSTITATNVLEDLFDSFLHAQVVVVTPHRSRLYYGVVERQGNPQDRNAGRASLSLRPITLGVNSETGFGIPNPQIVDTDDLLGV